MAFTAKERQDKRKQGNDSVSAEEGGSTFLLNFGVEFQEAVISIVSALRNSNLTVDHLVR
jgi:hypothetical protein